MNSEQIKAINTAVFNTPYDQLITEMTAAIDIYTLFPSPENKCKVNNAALCIAMKSTYTSSSIEEVNNRSKKLSMAIDIADSITSN